MALTQVQQQMLGGATSTSTPIQVGGTTVATFTSTGLGIGATPSFPLQVYGAGSTGGQGTANTYTLVNTNISSNSSGLWFGGMSTETTAVIGTATATGNLAFQTYNSGWGERMRIPYDGGIRIAMENYGSAPSSTNWGVSINNTGAGSRFFGQGTGTETQIEFGNRNGTRGSIQTNSTNTVYNTSSDYRLKENVHPMVGALDKVALLKPCTYTWKVDGSDGQGFIAHELGEVIPDCVSGEKDAVDENGEIKPQQIDTSFLVATLTAAIQELNAKITSLEEQVLNLGVK